MFHIRIRKKQKQTEKPEQKEKIVQVWGEIASPHQDKADGLTWVLLTEGQQAENCDCSDTKAELAAGGRGSGGVGEGSERELPESRLRPLRS